MKKSFFLTAILLLTAFAKAGAETDKLSFAVKPMGPVLSRQKKNFGIIGLGGLYSLKSGRNIIFFSNNIWLGEKSDNSELEGVVDSAVITYSTVSVQGFKDEPSYVSDENGWPLPMVTVDFKEYSNIRKYWVKSAIKIEGRYYAYYSIMNNYGRGVYDYFRVGQGLMFSESVSGPYIKAKAYKRNSFWNDVEPAFGEAVLEDADGWIYLYGKNSGAVYRKGASLARVRPEKIADLDSYLYYTEDYDNKKWSSDVVEASIVIEGADEEFSVSYNRYLKRYLVFYFDEAFQTVFMKTAPYPWGKWSEPVRIRTCVKDEYCFNAKEQPALAEENGRKIYFTLEKKHVPYLYRIEFK